MENDGINIKEAEFVRINRLLDGLIGWALDKKDVASFEHKLNLLDALFRIVKKAMTPEEVEQHSQYYAACLAELNKLKANRRGSCFYEYSRMWEDRLRQIIFNKKNKSRFFPE